MRKHKEINDDLSSPHSVSINGELFLSVLETISPLNGLLF